jgi:hypothetical protein
MESAPASIPPMMLAVFAEEFTHGTVRSSRKSWNPADSASRSAGDRNRRRHQIRVIGTGRIV